MRKRTTCVAAIAIGLLLLPAAVAPAARQVVRAGNLFLADNGGIFPSVLPKHGGAPVSARLEGEIGTLDGSHPPAVETIALDVDRTIELDARGLPTCRFGQIQSRETFLAKRACRDAIIGSGEAEVEVAFPEQAPFAAKGPIVLFNGGVHGGTTLVYVHAYVAVPAPTAIVTTAELTDVDRGRFGLHIDARIPPIAGGAGSVTRFRLGVGRRFVRGGRKVSFLTASCPTGQYLTEGEIQFSDGTRLGETHAFPCTPRR
ncbi:MAG: hypothetical protein ABW065_01565 [Solirubrobacterales bacterium]